MTTEPVPAAPTAVPAPAVGQAAFDRSSELARLRQAQTVEQARLDALLEARANVEADLTRLRRDLATARREFAVAGPVPPAPSTLLPSPLAPSTLAPPPPVAPPLALPRPPRSEPATGPGSPRVFVHLRAGSAAAAETAASLTGPLRDAGFEVADLRAVPNVPSQRVVRYFHAEDAAAAARLAGRLGRGWAIQDFRTYEPAPAPQTLEIWLPDR